MADAKAAPVIAIERVGLSTPDTVAAVLWLDRPDQLNAIDSAMLAQLGSAFTALDADPQVRVVLIIGRGRAFSAGGDLKSYLTLQKDATAFQRYVDDFQHTMGRMKYLRKPVVALVNGVTAAGGLELLLACDFAYAARSARIGDAHLNYGQMGGGGSLALLPRTIGPVRARELLFSARMLTADEALSWGLVNAVFDDDALLPAGVAFAEGVAAKSPKAVANAKYAMNAGFADGTGLDAALRLERERAVLYCLTAPDSMEGLQAFAERRKPKFPAE